MMKTENLTQRRKGAKEKRNRGRKSGSNGKVRFCPVELDNRSDSTELAEILAGTG
jgi:hypothetical protein